MKKLRRSPRNNPGLETGQNEKHLEQTVSPPRPSGDGALTPKSSSPPQFPDTQVASQVHFTQLDVKEEVKDVWGYLTPMNAAHGEVLTLSKRTNCFKKPESGSCSRRGAKKPHVATGGYILGRHVECDIVVEAPIVSNRHCVIFKVCPSASYGDVI